MGDCDVFAIQEKIIDHIVNSVQEQQAVETAPTILDPLQQTVITLLRGYLNSPAVTRNDVRDAMRRLRSPMTHSAIRILRRAYERFQVDQGIESVISQVRSFDSVGAVRNASISSRRAPLTREELHLVCFDYVWS